jgi:quinol monooxygenase YgiN
MIHVIATIQAKPGQRDALLAEFHKNVPNVRAEKGCIEYAGAVDLPTDLRAQIPLRENVFTVVEKWESLDALRAHLAAPHMAAYRERTKDLVAGTTLQILEPR